MVQCTKERWKGERKRTGQLTYTLHYHQLGEKKEFPNDSYQKKKNSTTESDLNHCLQSFQQGWQITAIQRRVVQSIQSLCEHPGGGLSQENTHWVHPGHKRHPRPQGRRWHCSYKARRSLTGQEEPSKSDSIHPESPVGHHSLSSVAAVCWTWLGREGKRLSQGWWETVQSYLVLMECLSGEARQVSDPLERENCFVRETQQFYRAEERKSKRCSVSCQIGWWTAWIPSDGTATPHTQRHRTLAFTLPFALHWHHYDTHASTLTPNRKQMCISTCKPHLI